jgi:hypothetical protein
VIAYSAHSPATGQDRQNAIAADAVEASKNSEVGARRHAASPNHPASAGTGSSSSVSGGIGSTDRAYAANRRGLGVLAVVAVDAVVSPGARRHQLHEE